MNNDSLTVSITSLPNEILESILSYTNYSPTISLVCKKWHEMSHNPQTAIGYVERSKGSIRSRRGSLRKVSLMDHECSSRIFKRNCHFFKIKL